VRERKMLGKRGVVRLSPDENVTQGIEITEGIEDGLFTLLGGRSPVWAATSANAMAGFPVLSGVECLTIWADRDEAGAKATYECAERWAGLSREVRIYKGPTK
jgi:hypothetical protein